MVDSLLYLNFFFSLCIFMTALGLAFQSLCLFDSFKGSGNSCFVPCAVVKRVLKAARPYYSETMV
jgi:hypothetical protein